MALYKAYGEITAGGATRTPFLVDLAGTTRVALADTGTSPDLKIEMAPTLTGGTFVKADLSPEPGKTLTNLFVRIVILPAPVTAVVEGTTPDPTPTDFVVLEYRTNPGQPMPPLVHFNVGQQENVTTTLDAGSPPAVPADTRIDDEYLVEAGTVPGTKALHIGGGLVNGPIVVKAGRKVTGSAPYKEVAASIRGIDLTRVLPAPPSSATSPRSATWFDVTATPSAPKPDEFATSLQVRVRTPHAGDRPDTAAQPMLATAWPGVGALMKGDYEYRVTFQYANGNESELSDPSNRVTLPVDGSVSVGPIPIGPKLPKTDPNRVLKRRIYRRRLDGGEDRLVGELDAPSATDPPPYIGSFDDANGAIDIGGGSAIAAGIWRPPARLQIHYAASQALDLTGNVTLVDSSSIDHYSGTVTRAPREVLVVNDDRTRLRTNLDFTPRERSRLRWSAWTEEPQVAPARTPRLTVSLPGMSTPFGDSVDVTIVDAPATFGFDWQSDAELLTLIDVRGTDDLAPIADPAPAFDPEHPYAGGPDEFGMVAVRLGTGTPAAAWPDGEATVGIELIDRVLGSYGTIVARGLRFATFMQGDGFPAPYHPDRMRAEVLLGVDPSQPPGGDRALRFLRWRDHQRSWAVPFGTKVDVDRNVRMWGRVGVLPDRFAVDLFPYATGEPWVGEVLDVTVTGRLRRAVAQMLNTKALNSPGDLNELRAWVTIDDTDALATGAPGSPAEVHVVTDKQDTHVDVPSPVHISAAVHANVGDRAARLDAVARVPTTLYAHHPPPFRSEDGKELLGTTLQVSAMPDGASGRVAATWKGAAVATRSGPQVRMRTEPSQPAEQRIDGIAARVLGFTGASFDTSKPVGTNVISTTKGSVGFTGRVNRSLRFEAVEDDARVLPNGMNRLAWKARMAETSDAASIEFHQSASSSDAVFFAKATMSTPWSDGSVWGLPAFHRDAGDPRGFAGIGNVNVARIGVLPAHVEFVDLSKVPFAEEGMPDYGGAERRPRVHTPMGTVAEGGWRIFAGGPLDVTGIAISTFDGDADVCLDSNTKTAGKQSTWSQVLVPILKIAEDPNGPDDEHHIWMWKYDQPPRWTFPPSAPHAPCDDGDDDGPDITSGTAFRIGGRLLVDLALRQYKLRDFSYRPWTSWDGFTKGSEAGATVGEWQFDTDLQMKGYRGEVTIVDAPTMSEKLGNPYGDWESGPGQWYIRQRDKLKLISYKGDLYLGNTGNGYHIPTSNGIFSTLAAIYNLVWP